MSETPASNDPQIENHAREQVGSRQVRMRIDERGLTTTYANAFRTNSSPEEVIIDFGLNLVTQPAQRDGGKDGTPGEILFQVTNRTIMNYYSAKRLAITLTQMIKRHEDQFGNLELNAETRRKKK
ncbi:MAG: DUF3467 domain-containing protein [Phycisphaeraceae bacterium]|nr:DUF3467 domain-containing protein [Phycisphaeraceae bacterium]